MLKKSNDGDGKEEDEKKGKMEKWKKGGRKKGKNGKKERTSPSLRPTTGGGPASLSFFLLKKKNFK
jgi:hypothetical protein